MTPEDQEAFAAIAFVVAGVVVAVTALSVALFLSISSVG